jgi:Tol biopolymer transport system component
MPGPPATNRDQPALSIRAMVVLAILVLAPLPFVIHAIAATNQNVDPFFDLPQDAAEPACNSAAPPSGGKRPVCTPPPPAVPPSSPPSGPLAGKVIAFTSALDLVPGNDGGGDGLRGGIYVVGADGSAPRKIITYPNLRRSAVAHTFQEPDDHPTISPDGRRIAWTSNRADPSTSLTDGKINWDIWVADINGANARQLTTGSGVDTEPTWSPDGSKIYWATGTDPFFGQGDLDIWRMNADGTGQEPVIAGPLPEFEPDVSPDGTKVAFTRAYFDGIGYRGFEIVVRTLSPPAEKLLTDNGDGNHDAFWSGSGARLFISSEHGNAKQPYGDIYRLNSSTGEVITRTTNYLLSRGDPAVSSDSKVIAAMQPILPVSRGPHVIDVMDIDGGDLGHVGGPGLVDIHPSIGLRADADGDGTADYLESGSVGVPALRAPKRVRAGRKFKVRFGWTHPEAWREMDAMELLLVGRRGPVASLRLLLGSRRLSAWNNSVGGYLRSGAAERPRVLRSGGLRLYLKRTRVHVDSVTEITAALKLRASPKLAGRKYRFEVQANDLDGDHQGERIAGKRIRVLEPKPGR